jgi:ABC-type lipoprotein release transport system permease subunit
MQRIAQVGNRVFAADPGAASNDIVVLGVQRPAQIVNYRSIGSTPLILAAALGAGAVAGLALTLMASVRRRWRELALLKSLGLGPRQLGWTIVWQATVAAVTGVVLGLPLGIVLGRQLWTLFARSLDAVPSPTVPALTVVLVGLGTLLFADLVAALPGARAARVSATSLLRAE